MKSTKATKAVKLSKREAAAQMDLPGFRVVVRGVFGTGKKAKRVRRVKTVHAANDGVACELAAKDGKFVAGLKDVYVAVLPPLAAVRAARKAA